MNIFYLHHAAPLAASMHCDVHVVKMVLETTQILCTVHHTHGNGEAVPYKPTHARHPSVLWAAESKVHYDWLAELGTYLCREYSVRYNRRHACEPHLQGVLRNPPPSLSSQPFKWREPPQAMPDECKIPGNSVEAYREYYRKHKASIAKWRFGIPNFMTLERKDAIAQI